MKAVKKVVHKKKEKPSYPGSLMTKKEERASLKQFYAERPEEKKKLKEMRKSNREMVHGKGVITRGKHKGLTKGGLKGSR